MRPKGIKMLHKAQVKRPPIQQPDDPTIRHIALTKGQVAVVDTVDYLHLIQYNWCAQWNAKTKTFYAQRHSEPDFEGKRRWIQIQTEIMQPPEDSKAYHRDGNGLDNRRQNLAVGSPSQALVHTRPGIKNTSGYRGVHYIKKLGKFRASTTSAGKFITILISSDPLECSKAYEHLVARRQKGFIPVQKGREVR